MPIPSLPLELTDEIIKWIPDVCLENEHGYYSPLLSCCLVCRAWLPTSRHQLFQVLWIVSMEQYDLLVSRVLHSEKMRVYLSYVLSVRLERFEDDPSWTRAFTLQFADHLPYVTHMAFIAGQTVEAFMPQPSSFAALSRFSSIQTLFMSWCTFPSFGAFRRILTFLPSLAHLNVDRPMWPAPAAELSPSLSYGAPAVARPALSSLEIVWDTDPFDRLCAQQFISWLSQTTTSSSLSSMRIAGLRDPMSTLGPSLIRFGRCVRELELRVERDDTGRYERFLSSFCSLEELRMRFYHGLEPDTWGTAEQLVQSLPCPAKLNKLSIEVFDTSSLDLGMLNGVVALDTALRPERFGALEIMELDVAYQKTWGQTPSLEEHTRLVIEKGLPQLKARNVLKVSFSEL